ncbi:nucleotidyltransferase domain-containing protein [Candidatus Pacearchaeota archaeon]|nr:nucleotidyltransferase domain-containing protein [Candidatus Pacearchaeota archaeon]
MKIELKERRFTTKIEEIQEIAKKIARNNNVKAVYLFGSYATGKQNILSDIDICIITKNDNEDVRFPVTDNLDVSYFHRLPLTIQFKVFKEGKPIVVKDKNFIYDLKLKTLKLYLDYSHIINRYVWENFRCTI